MNQLKPNLLSSRLLLLLALLFFGFTAFSQVTNASITGAVNDDKGEDLVGVTVTAKHEPSGTLYGTTTRADGRFTLPNVRIGGPYTITAVYTGYKQEVIDNVNLSLGQNFRAVFKLAEESSVLSEVVIAVEKNAILNGERTGATTNINKATLEAMPTLGRSLNDFVRLTPQSRSSSVASTAGAGVSFAGQDSRYNNLTLDGSIYNNSFGLASAPGGQTNSTPISLDAIEEIQVNLAPYDVRQGGFTGAGINAVTRSGTNQVQGSVFYNIRNEKFVGTKAGDNTVNVTDFNVNQFGGRLGGPIVKDKIFFFVNWESERRADPTLFFADRDGDATNNNTSTSKAQAADLDEVSRLLDTKFGYKTGAYENYDFETFSNKALAKLDFNLNPVHRLSLRYNYLRSARDVQVSNSGTFTSGSSRNGNEALAFRNSNYIINNDIHSFIAEVNSLYGNRLSNQFQVGFTANRDYRSSDGAAFPLIDILDGANRSYITAGYEPFTPNNRLDTDTWQAQDNVTLYRGNNTITAGVNFEFFTFENTFTPTYYGQYIFNNMDDFRKAVNGDSVALKRYVLTYSALPERALPTATTKVYQPGAYLQNETRLFDDRLTLTYGLRVDVPIFGNTALRNSVVDTLKFKDENGAAARYSTEKLPDEKFLFSPRLGFNWDVFNNRSLQVRGGTGIFSGRPPFVWISNQIGNNGILTGQIFRNNTNTKAYPFSGDITRNIPADAKTPASYNLALTDNNFRFQQVWRSDLSIDKKLPWGLVGTLEGLYSKTLNNIYYINANQEPSTARFSAGPDNRPYFPGLDKTGSTTPTKDNATRVVDFVSDATVLKNTNKGYTYSLTAKLEKQFSNNWYAMAAYNFAEAKDIVTGGSIAFSSWRDNRSINGNNLPDLTFSDFDQRHRVIAGLSYKINYLKAASTQVSLFLQSGNQGRASVFYSGDMNGDNQNGNDLLYVPNDANELQFRQFQRIFTNTNGTKDTIRITPQMQATALNEYIAANPYLADNKGGYIERNELLLDWLTTVDLSVVQEFYIKVGGSKHTLQVRGDIYNFGNLLNSAWGVSDFISNASPVAATGTSKNGAPVFEFGSIGSDRSYQKPQPVVSKSSALGSVWQAQLGVRYIFN
jgi:hypothetical protein